MADIHSQLSGLDLHDAYQFVQATDPGPVGANLNWLDTSSSPFTPKRRNSGNSAWIQVGKTGATAFTGLSDVPNSYSGQGSKLVAVNSGATALEFILNSGSVPGWITNHPDTPPISPSANDDEFTTAATLPGGGSAIWTALTGSSTLTLKNQRLVMSTASSSLQDGIYQATPTAPWTITTKISMAAVFATATQCGLFLRESSTGKLRIWQLSFDTIPKLAHQTWTSTGSSGASNVFVGANIFPFAQWMYLRIVNDSTNFNMQYSTDGVIYTTLSTAGITTTLTPNQMGIAQYTSAGVAIVGSYQFFRRS